MKTVTRYRINDPFYREAWPLQYVNNGEGVLSSDEPKELVSGTDYDSLKIDYEQAVNAVYWLKVNYDAILAGKTTRNADETLALVEAVLNKR